MRRGIADYENLLTSWNRAVALNTDAAGAVGGRAQPFTCRRRRDAGGPDDGFAGDAFTGDDDAVGVDLVRAMSEAHLDAELLKPRFGFGGQALRKRAENPGRHVHEYDSRRRWVDAPEL